MSTTASTDLASYPGRYFAVWNGRDADAAESIVTESLEWIDPLLPAPLSSLAEAKGFFQGAWAGFPDFRIEGIGEPLVDKASGRVAQEWRMTGTHEGEFPPGAPPTGKPFSVIGTDVWEVGPDGRATSVHAYYDVAGLMGQLGLA